MQVVGAPCHAEAGSATKLDLVVQIVRDRWKARDLVLDALQPGGHRCFGLNMLVPTHMYLEALVACDSMFARGSPVLHHNKAESYYQCLVALHALPGFDTCGHAEFLQLLGGQDLPVEAVAPALGAADGVLHADDDVLAIENDVGDVPGDVAAPVVAQALPAAVAIGVADGAAGLLPVMFENFVACSDRWSHSSGVLRCYVLCTQATHFACCRYMQSHQRPRRNEVLATLVAWAELGAGISREAHESRTCVVRRARIEQMMRLLP